MHGSQHTAHDRDLAAPPLLGPGDPAPVRVMRETGGCPAILLCDHATNAVPAALGKLGLPAADLAKHIAYDIGAAGVTEGLSARLDAPAIFSGYSRLVVDPNRHLTDPSSIPLISDDIFIPGNEDLSVHDRAARAEEIFWPYHHRLEALIESHGRVIGRPPVLISMHSFTPVMKGSERPWHIGVLYDEDRRLSDPMLALLREQADLVVGDNQPYTASSPRGFTTEKHAVETGRLHLLLELRQDLIADASGQQRWADLLAPLLKRLLDSVAAGQIKG